MGKESEGTVMMGEDVEPTRVVINNKAFDVYATEWEIVEALNNNDIGYDFVGIMRKGKPKRTWIEEPKRPCENCECIDCSIQ